MKALVIVFFMLFLSNVIIAQEFAVDDSVLYFNGKSVDTFRLETITKRHVTLSPFSNHTNIVKESVSKIFRPMPKDKLGQKMHIRYEDAYLVDDIFILAEVLGYNGKHFLMTYLVDGSAAIGIVHQSQVSSKDRKKFKKP